MESLTNKHSIANWDLHADVLNSHEQHFACWVLAWSPPSRDIECSMSGGNVFRLG